MENCSLTKTDFTFPPCCDMKCFCASKWHEDRLITFWLLHLYPSCSALFLFRVFSYYLTFFLFLSFLCNSVCFLSKESFSAHEHKNPRGDLFLFCIICLKPFNSIFWFNFGLLTPFSITQLCMSTKSVTKIVSN